MAVAAAVSERGENPARPAMVDLAGCRVVLANHSIALVREIIDLAVAGEVAGRTSGRGQVARSKW
jgi:hypothetical protein